MADRGPGPIEIEKEHQLLANEHEALRLELEELRNRPNDREAHDRYIGKLKRHLESLRSHNERLRRRFPPE